MVAFWHWLAGWTGWTETILFILGAAISWYITHIYYRKSLKDQERSSRQQIARLTEVLKRTVNDAQRPGVAAARIIFEQNRIKDCVDEYTRAGTPVRFIDTYHDLSDDQKADLLDTVLMRARGRPARDNKYRR